MEASDETQEHTLAEKSASSHGNDDVEGSHGHGPELGGEGNDGGGDRNSDHEAGEFIHAVRKSKTKEEREAAKGGKVGNPGRFKGKATEVLESHRTSYDEIKEMGKGRNKAYDEFWFKLHTDFWQKVLWQDVKDMWGEKGKDWEKRQAMRTANEVSTADCL